jgi:aldehyde:ferredoxin oxidoreductase
MVKTGGTRQYLVIDLTGEQWEVKLLSDALQRQMLGGEALALHLCSVHATSGSDAPFCLALGTLAGSRMPCTQTLSLASISPQNNSVQVDTATTTAAESFVSCGWQAIVITGVARRQMTLRITSDSVSFTPSERLIGASTTEATRLLTENPHDSVLSIGPAGERQVPSATIVCAEKALERFGFGAVLGAKHIKALVFSAGSFTYTPYDTELFAQTQEKILQHLKKSSWVKKYQQAGPLGLLDVAQKRGFAAVENSTKRTDPRLFHMSSQECSRKYALEKSSCNGCLLGCQRQVMRAGGKDTILPDAYEMMALGSQIGNFDPALVMQWRSRCIELGLHPVSTGMSIGSQLDEDQFGDTAVIGSLIEQISRGDINARKDVVIDGRPMAPIDPRGAWGQSLLCALGEDTPLVVEIIFDWLNPTSVKAKAEWVLLQQQYLAILRSIGLCDTLLTPLFFDGKKQLFLRIFSRFPRFAQHLISFSTLAHLVSSYTGLPVTGEQLLNAARHTVQMKHHLAGDKKVPADLPQRFMMDGKSNCKRPAVVPWRKLVERYQFIRAIDEAKREKE